MEKDQKMTLGCGTLILIALIVLIFGNISVDRTTTHVVQLRNEVSQLRQEVQRLQRMVSSQGNEIRQIREDVRRLVKQAKQP